MPEEDYSLEEEIDPMEEAAAAALLAERMRQEEEMLPASLPTAPARPAPRATSFEETMNFQPRLLPDPTRAPGVPSVAPPPFVRSVQLGPPRDVPMTAAVPGPLDMRSLMLMQQYEANEGYRRDIAQGMNQAEAMAKWGPTMFTSRTGTGLQPKYMNVGGRLYQVGLGGVSAPLTPEVTRPQYRNVGGQLFELGGTNAPRALTPEPVSRLALQDRAAIVKRMGNIQTILDADPNVPNANELRKELVKLQRERDAITTTRTAVAPPSAPPPPVAAPVGAPIPPTTVKKRRGGPKDKLARAQELELQYPDASKEDIMEMLKLEFE